MSGSSPASIPDAAAAMPNPETEMATLDFETLLDAAIARVRDGESLDDVLTGYGEIDEALRPLVEMATLTLDLGPAPSTERSLAKARVRAVVMRAAEERLARQPLWQTAGGALRPVGMTAAAASTVLALGGGTVVASASALPGEPLYGVKLAVEDVRVAATSNAAEQATLHAELAQKRIEEAQALTEKKQPVPASVIEAAAKHAEAAENAATRVEPARQAQVQAAVSAAGEQRTETLTRLLESDKLPAPAQTAVAHALSQGRAARASNAAAVATAVPTAAARNATAVPTRDDQDDRGNGRGRDDADRSGPGENSGQGNRGSDGNSGRGNDAENRGNSGGNSGGSGRDARDEGRDDRGSGRDGAPGQGSQGGSGNSGSGSGGSGNRDADGGNQGRGQGNPPGRVPEATATPARTAPAVALPGARGAPTQVANGNRGSSGSNRSNSGSGSGVSGNSNGNRGGSPGRA